MIRKDNTMIVPLIEELFDKQISKQVTDINKDINSGQRDKLIDDSKNNFILISNFLKGDYQHTKDISDKFEINQKTLELIKNRIVDKTHLNQAIDLLELDKCRTLIIDMGIIVHDNYPSFEGISWFLQLSNPNDITLNTIK